MVRVYVVTLGCPKNRVDTENMLGRYSKFVQLTDVLSEADVVLINTCSFIKDAVEESIYTILEVSDEIQKLSKKVLLVVTGCLVKRYGKGVLKREIPEVDVWLDIDEQKSWLELISHVLKEKAYDTGCDWKRIITTPLSYAYLKIAEGCNHRCSFCLIPSIRGRYRSKDVEKIKKEVELIVSQGIKEIVVVAQDVTFYGRDRGVKHGLKDLLRILLDYDIKWLRLLYLSPSGITKDFLKFLKSISPPFLPYFDVPIQHSHPEILKKMRRPLNSLDKIKEIREVFPEACIRTSVIVGFPYEKEYHFEHLLRCIEDIRFNHLGVFKYSAEEGSEACEFEDQVDEDTKERRKDILLKLQKKISKSILENYKNTVLDVLVDESCLQWPGLYVGRTWFQAPEIDGITYVSCIRKNPVGEMVKVEIKDTYDYDLSGLEVFPDSPELSGEK